MMVKASRFGMEMLGSRRPSVVLIVERDEGGLKGEEVAWKEVGRGGELWGWCGLGREGEGMGGDCWS